MSRTLELEATMAKGEAAKRELEILKLNCHHKWRESIYNPEITGGYTVPGDPPGTMGIDFRGSYKVPEERKDRWSRTCSNCEKVEFTYTTRVVKTEPHFTK